MTASCHPACPCGRLSYVIWALEFVVEGAKLVILKKLTVHGFKSFADRLEFMFDAGITAIAIFPSTLIITVLASSFPGMCAEAAISWDVKA